MNSALPETAGPLKHIVEDKISARPVSKRLVFGHDYKLDEDTPEVIVWPPTVINEEEAPKPADERVTEDIDRIGSETSGIYKKTLGKVALFFLHRSNSYEDLLRARQNIQRKSGGIKENDISLSPTVPKKFHSKLHDFRTKTLRLDGQQKGVNEDKTRIKLTSDSLPYDSRKKWGMDVDWAARREQITSFRDRPSVHGFYYAPDGRKVPMSYDRIDTFVDPNLDGAELEARRSEIEHLKTIQQQAIHEAVTAWLEENPGPNVDLSHPIDLRSSGILARDSRTEEIERKLVEHDERRKYPDLDNPHEAIDRINQGKKIEETDASGNRITRRATYSPSKKKHEAKQLREWILLNRKAHRVRTKRLAIATGTDSTARRLKRKAERHKKLGHLFIGSSS